MARIVKGIKPGAQAAFIARIDESLHAIKRRYRLSLRPIELGSQLPRPVEFTQRCLLQPLLWRHSNGQSRRWRQRVITERRQASRIGALLEFAKYGVDQTDAGAAPNALGVEQQICPFRMAAHLVKMVDQRVVLSGEGFKIED
nr:MULTISPECIES: hypothetical protein [unclassified Pseudomonas]